MLAREAASISVAEALNGIRTVQNEIVCPTLVSTFTCGVQGETRSRAASCKDRERMEQVMGNLLYWAVAFLIIGIIAAAFGFGGAAGTAIAGAKILFWVAVVLFVITLIGGLIGRGRSL